MEIFGQEATCTVQFDASSAAEAAYIAAAYAPDFYGDMDQFASELSHAWNAYWDGYFHLSLVSSKGVLNRMNSIRNPNSNS